MTRNKQRRGGTRFRYSEKQLGLEPRWFTGKQWESGVAQIELVSEYKQRTKELNHSGEKPIAADVPNWIIYALARW
jgi:hypothetical protein